jgi:hypothetical protein
VTVKDKNHRIRLGEWQKSYRHDMMSLFADPLFVCPEKRDFRLKPDSPLLKGPFRNIDLSSAGVRPAGDAKSGG